MDVSAFDRLASSLANRSTRRAALRALAGGGLGAGLAALGLRESALACKKNGETCSRKEAEKCCSGTCEKKRGKRRCVKADGAFGCSNEQRTDFCRSNFTPCPNNPDGRCIVDVKKRPFCANLVRCASCQSNQDCPLPSNAVAVRCLKRCSVCPQTGGSACALLGVFK